ncbi:hypothetical protein [Microbacterium rhizomatis]|uniref:Glycosyltransferase RgtA/B/C/D-like domain-containing protein n=1 Tax=Microbacterium rhizomatis TaxID=1631477 RepID=A0A5J5J245_9MICO|nr:hypothetical protein [Microbacterium rhizomatis]KAA9110247.1 hypothetical protein F6B43_00630 [Microbacterium rhizomatis]
MTEPVLERAAAPSGARLRAASAILGATALIAVLTALIVLARAGGDTATAWPVTWELQNSDNGVLFQYVHDMLTGRTLDWSFSPQVYVFPEVPMSVLAYVLAGGSVQAYFVFVAAINNAALFLGLYLLVRLLHPSERQATWLARAGIAMLPLLILPLLGTSWLQSYHLAPTYYFGMYLLVIAAPSFYLVSSTRSRVLLGAAIVLTAASNPLALVFCVPPLILVLLVRSVRHGFRSTRRAAAVSGILLLTALAVRVVFFSRLQGTSPLNYIDLDAFLGRLGDLEPHFALMVADTTTRIVLTVGALCAVACLVFAIVGAVRYLRADRSAVPTDRALVGLYFGLVPLAGLSATAALLITHYLYAWLVLIGPMVFVLLAVPRRWVPRVAPIGAGVLLVTGMVTGAVSGVAGSGDYLTARSAETQCLDENLPAGVELGYSTFSDARRLSLTSERPFRLIQITADAQPSYWLTNRTYAKTEGGQFFYINDHGDEAAISTAVITGLFGNPDSSFGCGPGQTVLVYSEPSKLAAIKTFYNENPGT